MKHLPVNRCCLCHRGKFQFTTDARRSDCGPFACVFEHDKEDRFSSTGQRKLFTRDFALGKYFDEILGYVITVTKLLILLTFCGMRLCYPFTAEAQTALFKDPVRTAL
jgi:hypothetical protein